MIRVLILCLITLLAHTQYTVVDEEIGSTYIKLALKYSGDQAYYVKPKSKMIGDLVFHFQALTYNEFTFKIYDPNSRRFEVPQGGIFPIDSKADFSFPLSIANYKINYTTQQFSFMVTRKETDAVIFDSSVVQLVFSEYYLQFGTILDSKTVFGYSERFTEHFPLKPGTWTIWNKDNGQKIDNGATNTGGVQTHGFYSIYMTR